MPFIDLNSVVSFPETSYDYVIIGAGAAGIYLSTSLAKANKKILLLESGDFDLNDEKQKLNEVEQTGKHLGAAVWGRKRAIGGTTIAWGGQSLPFNRIDFLEKGWIKNSGWPFGITELSTHYVEANRFMKIDTLNYRSDIFKLIKIDTSKLNFRSLDYHVSKWARQPNFYKLHKKKLQKNVDVYYNSQLVKMLFATDNKKIIAVEVANFIDKKFTIPVNKLIIAAGGLETNRILLLNDFLRQNKKIGIGFMDHPCIEIGQIKTNNLFKLQRFFNTHFLLSSWAKYSIRMQLNEDEQSEMKLLGGSASIMFTYPENSLNPYSQIKSLLKNPGFRLLVNFVKFSPAIFKGLYILLRYNFIYKPAADAKLVLMVEQEPLDASTIKLSDEHDKFGLPKIKLNWAIGVRTWKTVVFLSNKIKQELESLKMGQVILKEEVVLGNNDWEKYLSDVNHHMGGCRMSINKNDGVVDANLKVFDVDNLYLCSSAVFPTSSHSNPTLTILALANRLVKHLTNHV